MAKIKFIKTALKAGMKEGKILGLLIALIMQKDLGLVWATKVVPAIPETRGIIVG